MLESTIMAERHPYTDHPFKILLERKFLEWQLQVGRKSQQEFADYLGVNRASVTMWLNGDHLPERANVDKLAFILGPEIYSALDMERPDPNLASINSRWKNIPADKQRKLAEDAARYEVKNNAENVQRSPKRRKTESN